MVHVGAPPISAGKPPHVSQPGSPFAGTVQNRHFSLPVSGSIAATNPRCPDPPPATPTRIALGIASGAIEVVYPASKDAYSLSKSRLPVERFSAIRWQSADTKNTLSPRIATPRLTRVPLAWAAR